MDVIDATADEEVAEPAVAATPDATVGASDEDGQLEDPTLPRQVPALIEAQAELVEPPLGTAPDADHATTEHATPDAAHPDTDDRPAGDLRTDGHETAEAVEQAVEEAAEGAVDPAGERERDVVVDITAAERTELEAAPPIAAEPAPEPVTVAAGSPTDEPGEPLRPRSFAPPTDRTGPSAEPTTSPPWRTVRAPDHLEQTVARPIRPTSTDDANGNGRQRGERVVVVRGEDDRRGSHAPGSSWDDDLDDAAEAIDDQRAVAAGDDAGYEAGDEPGYDDEPTGRRTDESDDWGDEADEADDTGTIAAVEERRPAPARTVRVEALHEPRRESADDLAARSVAHFVQVAVSAGWLAALIAGARAVIAVGAAANRSGDGLTTWQRFGAEMGQLGTTQALVLVVAVVLLGMSSLGGSRAVERSEPRSSSGLGIVGAAAVIGIVGGLLAFFASRDLGTPTASALVDLVGAVGLSFAALLTALVSLRARRLG